MSPIKLDEQFLEEFASESDRAVAVLGGAYLDSTLEQLIERRMVRGGKREGVRALLDGSLRNFTARVEVAFAMGVLADVEATDLRLLNEVRNLFAHKLHGLDFEDNRVVALCRELKCIQDVSDMLEKMTTRLVFSLAAIHYLVELRRRTENVISLEEITPSLWPPIKPARTQS